MAVPRNEHALGGEPRAGHERTGDIATSDNIIASTKANCQVCHLVGQAAVLAYKSWLAGRFRKARAHNAVFVALLDLAAREGA